MSQTMHAIQCHFKTVTTLQTNMQLHLQIFVSSILPQIGRNSSIVPAANDLAAKVARQHRATYLKVDVPECDEAWWDNVHLSDWGLLCWIRTLETILRPIISGLQVNSDDFPPLQLNECESVREWKVL